MAKEVFVSLGVVLHPHAYQDSIMFLDSAEEVQDGEEREREGEFGSDLIQHPPF